MENSLDLHSLFLDLSLLHEGRTLHPILEQGVKMGSQPNFECNIVPLHYELGLKEVNQYEMKSQLLYLMKN